VGLSEDTGKSVAASTAASEEDDEAEDPQTLFTIQPSFVDLALRANGKGDLYFHAYIINAFVQGL